MTHTRLRQIEEQTAVRWPSLTLAEQPEQAQRVIEDLLEEVKRLKAMLGCHVPTVVAPLRLQGLK